MSAPLEIGRPQPGFYRTKLVKGGPWVPVRLVTIQRREIGEDQ